MPAVGKIVSSITTEKILPKVVDQVLSGNVLLMRLLRDKSKNWSGGYQLNIPVNMTSYTALGSFSGYDTLATAQQSTRQNATFNPSEEYVLVTVSGIQKAMNKGPEAAVDLIAAEMSQRAKDLQDEMGSQLYKDGTGNSSKDILGLGAAVDDATNITTYGGLSRSTYANWKATYSTQSGAIALSDLASDFDAAAVGSDMPTLIATTPAVFSLIEALYTPTTSHQFSQNDFRLTADGLVKVGGPVAANQGFRALTFRGIPIVADEKCPSGKIFTLNENSFSMYKVSYDSEFATGVKDGFQWTGWKKPVNQNAIVGYMMWAGQLVCDSPRKNAQRVSVTS